MPSPTREQLASALTCLVEAAPPTATRLMQRVRQMAKNWSVEPMVFGGDLSVLNVLIDVGVKKPDALEAFFKVVTEKRRAAPMLRRRDYQRNLMRARRGRIAKALQLHELRVGHLGKTGRDKFAKEQLQRWERDRDTYVSSRPGVAWKDRNALISEFWTRVDTELDEALAPARSTPQQEVSLH